MKFLEACISLIVVMIDWLSQFPILYLPPALLLCTIELIRMIYANQDSELGCRRPPCIQVAR